MVDVGSPANPNAFLKTVFRNEYDGWQLFGKFPLTIKYIEKIERYQSIFFASLLFMLEKSDCKPTYIAN